MHISSLGLGSYWYVNGSNYKNLDMYNNIFPNCIKEFIKFGGNILDTSPRYMEGCAEHIIGNTLYDMISRNEIKRNEIVIITKGWYDKNIDSFKNEITKSLNNLNVKNIDIYLVHNHDRLFTIFNRAKALIVTENIFRFLEDKVKNNTIKYYGISVGDFLFELKGNLYDNLYEVYSIVEKINGNKNNFKVIEFPLNINRIMAFLDKNQKKNNKTYSLFEAANELDLNIIITESCSRGRLKLNNRQMMAIYKFIENGKDVLQKQLQIVRSLPGVKSALFSSKNTSHIKENMELRRISTIKCNNANNIFHHLITTNN